VYILGIAFVGQSLRIKEVEKQNKNKNKMKLLNVKVSLCYESETNPRGTDFDGAALNELVASVKEKGVLVPVLVRPRAKGQKEFEIVAGNRRFRAAQKVGLAEIPAQVQEMTDDEAREAQIVENLQREDIHPLEEGEAYRKLIEEGKNYDLEAVAAKVGKSVSYVRRRLILTDLTAPSKAAYRRGKINAGHAELVSRLDSDEQAKALAFISRREPDMDELREEVQKLRIGKLVATPPWKSHEAIVAAMAPCEQCNKKKGGDLFGEGAAEQCGDPTCFARRLAAHLELVKQDMKVKKIPLSLISTHWKSEVKGALASDAWNRVNAKVPCKSQHKALVVDGDDDLGQVINICTDPKCEVHGEHRGSVYKRTPKEIAARKRELSAQKAKKAREERELVNALKKVSWPISEKVLDMLLEVKLRRGTMVLRPVAQRLGIEPKVSQVWYNSEHTSGYKARDWEKPLREYAAKLTKEDKAKLLVELEFVDHSYIQGKLAKML